MEKGRARTRKRMKIRRKHYQQAQTAMRKTNVTKMEQRQRQIRETTYEADRRQRRELCEESKEAIRSARTRTAKP